jgi:hypothetical protein
MRVKALYFVLIGCLSALLITQPLAAQSKNKSPISEAQLAQLKGLEDTLAILAFAIVNDSLEQARFAACRVFIPTLVRALKTENSFYYPFERLKSISIIAPPDSSFRIFTWQLFVHDSSYRYYGAIQMNKPKLELFPLMDHSMDMEYPMPVEDTLHHDNWYGALYYTIRQFESNAGRQYLLIGFDGFGFFDKRKVIDVLSFDKAKKPVFGANVFYTPEGKPRKEKRLIWEYSAEAKVRINWDEQYQMVLMDHLIPMGSPYNRGITNVPDGSYDALKYEKKRWTYIEKVFNDSMEKPPFPEPILQGRGGADIMGKAPKAKKQKSKSN